MRYPELTESERKARIRRVQRKIRQGVPKAEIARQEGISRGRLYQILARTKIR